MIPIIQITAILLVIEIILFFGFILYILLPDFKWYRKLRKGTWYYTTAKDCDGNIANWWTKHKPKTEDILIVEFN